MSKNNTTIIIAALFIALAAGTLSGFLVFNKLSATYNASLFDKINSISRATSTAATPPALTSQVVVQTKSVQELGSPLGNNLVGIFKKKTNVPTSTPENIFNPDAYYYQGSELGDGLVITSDGWILTGLTLNATQSGNYIIVDKDKKVYNIINLEKDEESGLSFIKIEASDFGAPRFVHEDEIQNGQKIIALKLDGGFKENIIVNKNYLDDIQKKKLVFYSDKIEVEVKLANEFGPEFAGAFLSDKNGGALGIIKKDNSILLLSRFNGVVQGLLKYGTISRVKLGFNYIDLSKFVNPNLDSNSSIDNLINKNKGALIYKNGKADAVDKLGLAYVAGLEEGDIILSINDTNIDVDHDLAIALSTFTTGDKINISYLRNGEEKEVKIKL
jgi:serine protease Do